MPGHGFSLAWEQYLEEYKSRVRLWTHDATGAELLSAANADENKVFGVTFRTPPKDSTGLPHILEHAVLCGSEKYPVREPFVELLKGSLQTFLNAFTYPDKTCYPVASANLADFRNLTDVYLDAVFFPRISEDVFLQEGWRLEPQGREFIFTGVVYNEMKGVFSSPESILGRQSLHALFPDTAYGLESGGDPEEIPRLGYADFVAFHKAYYHPSNARFFFWGDDPEEERLALLAPVLARFTRRPPAPAIAVQQRYHTPQLLEVPYAAGEEEDKALVSRSWLLSETGNVELTLSLRMLEHILLGMPASPLRRALIESGLGEDLTNSGLETELRQLVFSAGLRGVLPDKAQDVETLMAETLASLAGDGIPDLCVEAALNSVEFALRENNTGRFPAGLSAMLQALTTWLHGQDPLAPLRYEAPLRAIKAKIAAGERHFESLIREWLLDNPHTATVVLLPERGRAERLEREEKERAAALVAPLSRNAKRALAKKAAKLKTLQETPDPPEALASIPRLTVADLPEKNSPIPAELTTQHAVPVHVHHLPTQGIVYVDLAFDFGRLPCALTPLLPLFCRALLEMGTANYDFLGLNMAIACKTGGMDAGPLILTERATRRALPRLVASGKAAPEKIRDLFDLFAEILGTARFDDRDRFFRMVLEEKARTEHTLIPAGHSFVATRLRAAQSAAGLWEERAAGVTQLLFLRSLAERLENDWPGVLTDLHAMRDAVIAGENLVCNVTAEGAQRDAVLGEIRRLAERIAGQAGEGRPAPPPLPHAGTRAAKEALIVPAQVNCVGLGANLYDAGYAYHGSVHVILKVLRTGWLWEKIRVQGGAYGAFCSLDRMSGAFVMVSYRDPDIQATLDVFARTADHLASISLSRRELDAAIVGAIGEIDAYLLPDAKGMASFTRALAGDTGEHRQKMRDEVFTASMGHFRDFGSTLGRALEQGRICALGGNALEKTAREQQWDVLRLL